MACLLTTDLAHAPPDLHPQRDLGISEGEHSRHAHSCRGLRIHHHRQHCEQGPGHIHSLLASSTIYYYSLDVPRHDPGHPDVLWGLDLQPPHDEVLGEVPVGAGGGHLARRQLLETRTPQPHHLLLRRAGLDIKLVPRTSAANQSIGEVVQSRRRPLLGPSPG